MKMQNMIAICDADRVYVLDHGRVVQVGTYQSLSAEPGLFRDLVARQQVDSPVLASARSGPPAPAGPPSR